MKWNISRDFFLLLYLNLHGTLYQAISFSAAFRPCSSLFWQRERKNLPACTPAFIGGIRYTSSMKAVTSATIGHRLDETPRRNPFCIHFRHSDPLRISLANSESTEMSTESSGSVVGNANEWMAYRSAMESVMDNERVLKKDKAENLVEARNYLLSNQLLKEPPSFLPVEAISFESSATDDSSFRERLGTQREEFINATGLSVAQYDYCTRCVSSIADFCAKHRVADPAVVAWRKLREMGMVPREKYVSTYLYVLGSNEAYADVCSDVATLHDTLFEPTEKSITLRIKILIDQGDAIGAENLLMSFQDKDRAEFKRLRTFLPILSHYCEAGDMASTLRLLSQMRRCDGVHLDADTYALVIGSVARRGCFFGGASPIEGAAGLGFSATSGPALFDDLASAMADDILELTEAAANTIFNSFATDINKKFAQTEDLVPPCMCLDNKVTVGRVSVNSTTAVCPNTRAKLRLFTLSETQRKQVFDNLLSMAKTQQEEHGDKLKAKDISRNVTRSKKRKYLGGEYALEELTKFSKFLEDRDGEPYTAFVDGANVAFFGHGDVHYKQIQLVVEHLERMGEKPLVTMPQKYVNPSFWLVGLGKKQTLSESNLEVMNQLLETKKMYTVPAACLDDYYWMLASVAKQKGNLLRIAPGDSQGRFPGLRPILITNDQMRDHKLELLEPQLFRRWTSSHIVNYKIQSYDQDEWEEERHVKFFPADFFSREIQGNEIEEGSVGKAWHFPVTGWPEHDRLCVLIPRSSIQ